MSERQRADMAAIRADDALLDALGRGEPAPPDDEIAVLLAAWRAELDGPAEPDAADDEVAPVVPIARARRSRRVWLVVTAVAVATTAAGTSVAAANGTPDSPLWPITRIVNPDRADTVDAQATLDQARRAITDGRRDDAHRLLDQADIKIARVRNPAAATRLRTELDSLRRALTALIGGVPNVVPGQTPSPGGTLPNGVNPSGAGSSGGPGPGSGSSGSGSGDGLPLPTNLPSLPLPTILPSIPGLPK